MGLPSELVQNLPIGHAPRSRVSNPAE